MSKTARQRCCVAGVAALWVHAAFWLLEAFEGSTTGHEIAALVATLGVAITGTAVLVNGRRINRLEKVCCALTQVILTDGLTTADDRRRHLTAVR